MKNKLVIITPFYNPGEFLDQCIASLMSQKYENYHIYFFDDASTDGSYDKLPLGHPNVTVITNQERRTALENIHFVITYHCKPEDIVVLVDGDDWLPNKKTLASINNFYNENECWIMYGQSNWTDGRRGFACAYTEEEFSSLRTTPFKVSHIRTFRAGLYLKIAEQDPTFSCMKSKDGEFYKMTYDVAIMFPIMEMAGFDKVKFNDSILYIYNRNNPISDDRVNQALQTAIHVEISSKNKFNKIGSFI